MQWGNVYRPSIHLRKFYHCDIPSQPILTRTSGNVSENYFLIRLQRLIFHCMIRWLYCWNGVDWNFCKYLVRDKSLWYWPFVDMNLHKRSRKTNEMNALSKRISINVDRALILQTTVALTRQQKFVIVDNLCTVKLL